MIAAIPIDHHLVLLDHSLRHRELLQLFQLLQLLLPLGDLRQVGQFPLECFPGATHLRLGALVPALKGLSQT